jgi:energy-coupling factor transporter ATP-binding protein EcfA2
MYIERVQVEEGFLNGFNAEFLPGLNVLIGARGTGKTSLIELIRFCLDAPANTSEVSKKGREHALSILGAGQVTVTLFVNGQTVTVSRTASDSTPRSSGFYEKPIIFSQTEIENVGLESGGRLRLIDSFLPFLYRESAEEAQAIAEIRSLTEEISRIRLDVEEIDREVKKSDQVNEELRQAEIMESNVAQTSEVLREKTLRLNYISSDLSVSAVNEQKNERSMSEIATWYHLIKAAQEKTIEGISDHHGPLFMHAEIISNAKQDILNALNSVLGIWHVLERNSKDLVNQRLIYESQARELRQEVEVIQAGAGSVMRRGQELREKRAKLGSMIHMLSIKRRTLMEIIERRGNSLDRLEKIRHSRYKARLDVIATLNQKLSPNIRLQLIRNGQHSPFAAAISDCLRGSGVRYNDIAVSIASTLSPRILLETVDNYDIETLANAAGVNYERASRVLSHLRTSDLGSLSSIDIEDEVSLQLLDGVDYKELNSLSTGQRCTVVLPIILAHANRILIVDQPEDHIDNAFIANTLIRALLGRGMNNQMIFSTHNPNIPVLGYADNVIQLGSDGRRGYVQTSGNLNYEVVVNAISNVMEGGASAFRRRADFYSGAAKE